MNEKEVREKCTELAEMCFSLVKENEDLKDYIDNICGIIEAEMPLKEQDLWLEDMKQRDLYKSEKCEQ